METDWPDLSDNDLTAKAMSGQEGARGAFVEAMRRLRASNDALRRSNELYGTWLIFLTVVLALLTLVLAFKM
jgi:hypothetical protein